MTHLDEKAIKTSYDLPWSLEEFTRKGQRCANIVSNDGTIVCEIRGILDSCGSRENGELIVRAVNSLGALSALPSSPVSEWTAHLERVASSLEKNGFSLEAEDCQALSSTLTTLSTRNAELEREVKRLREAQQWQPIETAPKDGAGILCAWFDDDGTTYAIAGWYESGIADQCWYDQYDDAICPTHWLPLPNPPSTLSTSPQGGEHE